MSRIVLIAILTIALPSYALATPGTCNLERKQVEYQIQDCSSGTCQSGAELLNFVGGKVLQHRSYEGGIIYTLGQTIRLEDDPLQEPGKYLSPNSAHNTILSATYADNVLTLREDEAIIRPAGDGNGHIISYQTVQIRPDCTFCDVLKYGLIGTLPDGTVVSNNVFSGSKCYVSDVPPDK